MKVTQPNNIWIGIVKTKYLETNKINFRELRIILQHHQRGSILDQRNPIKRGLKQILGNGKSINFWHYIWLNDRPLIDKIPPDKIIEINPVLM